MLHSECLTLAINQFRRSIHIGIAWVKPTKIPTVIGLYYNTSRGPLEPDRCRSEYTGLFHAGSRISFGTQRDLQSLYARGKGCWLDT